MSFGDNYYFTEDGRQKLNASFEKLGLTNLTADIPENIDHIILSNEFIKGKSISVSEWNRDKKLSDHIGVCVMLGTINA
jgi:endonuclease/exonuclease/phosphatase family metal-dependent hydrolase